MSDDAIRELELSSELEAITRAASDFGHLVHKVPDLVAFPRDAEEVVRLVRYASERDVPLVARGRGHSVFGQAQCDGGIVCDMSLMDAVMIDSSSVVAGAGARWSAVLDACSRHGLTPPVLPNFLELSVGGTLSVGGIGGTSHLYGPLADHVRELELVTPDGRRVVCSPEREPDVFFGALATGGRGGIIVGATIPVIAAHERATAYRIPFPTAAAMIAGQLELVREQAFDHVEGQILRDETGAWQFFTEVAAFHAPGDGPVDPGLGIHPAETADMTYLDLCHRIVPRVRLLASTGDWYRPHPWFSAFLPADTIEQYISEALAMLTPQTLGPGPVLLYPLRRGPVPSPALLAPAPAQETFFCFSILRTAATSEAAADALAQNERLADAALAAGGTLYDISALKPSSAATRM